MIDEIKSEAEAEAAGSEGDAPPRAEKLSQSGNAWSDALMYARAGDVRRARSCHADATRGPEPFPGAFAFLLGRSLAEAGTDLNEAEELITRVIDENPKHISAPHVLGLIYLRQERPHFAQEIFEKHRLPHDSMLLAQTTLTMEMQTLNWPTSLPEDWPEPVANEPNEDEATATEADVEGDDLTNPPVKSDEEKPFKPTRKQKRALKTVLPKIEKAIIENRPVEAMRDIQPLLDEGANFAELQMLAGLAAEAVGDLARARICLALALKAEPTAYLTQTFLGRVYWREGKLDLAETVLRGVQVMGPEDFGRHYHLALVHESRGNRRDALTTFLHGLDHYFIEAREFYIERAYWRWREMNGLNED